MDLIVDDNDNHFLKHYNRVGNENQSSPFTITPDRKKKVDLLPKQTPACPHLTFGYSPFCYGAFLRNNRRKKSALFNFHQILYLLLSSFYREIYF